MKNSIIYISLISSFFLVSLTCYSQKNWTIDFVNSRIGFKVSQFFLFKTIGQFDAYSGSMISVGDDFTNVQMEFKVDVRSLFTGNPTRDKHLMKEKFFNAEKYPEMKFRSNSMQVISKGNYLLLGDIKIKNVVKKISLNVIHQATTTDSAGVTRAVFHATSTINRSDFYVTGGEGIIGNMVDIMIDLTLIN